MSGYLMRLTRRAGAAGEAQSLQPFVRSASPVAERDQRIGMRGFEGFEFGESSLAEEGLETGGTLPPPAPRDMGETMVQRKMASPAAGPAVSPTPGATDEGIPIADSLPPLAKGDRGDFQREEPGILEIRQQYLTKGEGRGRDLQGPDQAEITIFQPEAAETYAEIASHAGPPGRAEPGHLRRGDGYTRSTRQVRQVDLPRIEPSARTFARHTEPLTVDAGAPADKAAEGPRVVIGRVNVEVVPPPAQPAAAAPRSGPLTAASVSVIGPLGGSVPAHRHLSLRHR